MRDSAFIFIMTMRQRHDEILRIIRESQAGSQQEILVHLQRRGIQVTQPTLSRDIRELGLVKSPAGYAAPSDLASTSQPLLSPTRNREQHFNDAVRSFVVSAAQSGAFVVLRTPPAEAQPVARAVDEAGMPKVLGTIGGDDTVFVATPSSRDATSLVRHIRSLLESHPRRPRA